jgi:DNA-binding CsgD family transcriptional regulator
MKQDVVAIVEAAYTLGVEDDAWFSGLVSAAAPAIERGLGLLAWQYDASDPAQVRVSSQRYAGGPDEVGRRMFEGLAGSTAEMTPRQNRMAYIDSGPVKTLSELYGGVPREQPGFGRHVTSMGAQDFLVVLSQDPSMTGCALAVPLPAITRASANDVRRWTRVAAHVAAGRRLRLVGPRTDGAAVLTPAGRVEHAEGAAKTKTARDALRDAALRVDRARSTSRGDPDEALALWEGLVAGRWSLVDRFDADGRRYLIAHENDPRVPDPRALSARERQVLAYAALGHPLKLTGYELGLSLSTVARHRANAMRKLGLRSFADVAQLFAR